MSEATILSRVEQIGAEFDGELLEIGEGVFKATLAADALADAASASRLAGRIRTIAGRRQVAVVLELSGLYSVSRPAMHEYGSITAVDAWAILGETPVDRLIGNYMLRVAFASAPAQFFESEGAALSWLAARDHAD